MVGIFGCYQKGFQDEMIETLNCKGMEKVKQNDKAKRKKILSNAKMEKEKPNKE